MSANESSPGRGTYLAVYLALLALMAATLAVAYIDLGAWSDAVAQNYGELGRWNTVAAMSIAFVKAVLVVLYFMHVRYGRPLIGLVAISGFIWLVLLIGGVATDYFSRGLYAPPPPVMLPEGRVEGRESRVENRRPKSGPPKPPPRLALDSRPSPLDSHPRAHRKPKPTTTAPACVGAAQRERVRATRWALCVLVLRKGLPPG